MRPIARIALTATAVALAAAGAALPGAAVAQDGGTVSPRGVSADGERFAVYVTTDRVAHVVDERDDSGSFETPLPPACVDVDAPAGLTSGGQYLLSCIERDGFTLRMTHLRLDLTTRAWQELPAATWLGERPARTLWTRPETIGGRWLKLWSSDGASRLVDWRSGEVRRPVGSATDAVDLDADEPLRAMCAPLRRPLPAESRSPAPFLDAQYDGEVAVAETWVGRALTVQGCGEARATVLDALVRDPQLGGGILTYSVYVEEGSATPDTFAYVPACRVRVGWALGSLAVAHTRRSLWVSRWRAGTSGASRVERRPLPDACHAIPTLRVSAPGRPARPLAAIAWDARGWGAGTAQRLPPPGTPAPRLARAGRTVTVRTASRASGLSWQVAGGAVRSARRVGRDGRLWRFAAPRGAAGRAVTVTARGVAAGGDARFAFTLGRR